MFDFNEIVSRKNTNSIKWDRIDDEAVPLWIADMDFKVAPCISDAINNRIANGVFGYTFIPDSFYESVHNWWSTKYNFNFEKESVIFSSGVVASISVAVRELTNENDGIVVLTPVYQRFFTSIEDNNRKLVESELIYEDNTYSINFEDLESKLKDNNNTMMIMCNPHNPIGKAWSIEELTQIGELCLKYNVLIVSDEIHCDLTLPGISYIPMGSISDELANNTITCVSPSKSFGISSLHAAAVIVPNKVHYDKMQFGIKKSYVAEPNTIAIDALVAAYSKGTTWLNELKSYISANRRIVKDFLEMNLNDVFITNSNSTYLLWLDCSSFTNDADKLCTFLKENASVVISSGNLYKGNGYNFIRINIACPSEVLREGLKRLAGGIAKFKSL